MADLMLNMGSRFCSNSVFLSSISHTEKSSMAFMITAMKIKNMMGKNHLSKPSDLLDGKSVAPEYQFIIHCEERKCFVEHFMNNLINDNQIYEKMRLQIGYLNSNIMFKIIKSDYYGLVQF